MTGEEEFAEVGVDVVAFGEDIAVACSGDEAEAFLWVGEVLVDLLGVAGWDEGVFFSVGDEDWEVDLRRGFGG